jgi:hypothetical protein
MERCEIVVSWRICEIFINNYGHYANQNGFKFLAKAGDKVWSVDETKTMEEIR